jgi:hypothetical protein
VSATIREADALALPASLLVPGHVTFHGVLTAVVAFTDDDGTPMVRVEYAAGDHDEYRADDDVVVLATVDRGLLAIAQDEAG